VYLPWWQKQNVSPKDRYISDRPHGRASKMNRSLPGIKLRCFVTVHRWQSQCHNGISSLSAFAKVRKASISFVVSVRLSPWNNLTDTRRSFVNFIFDYLSKNLSRYSSFIKIGQECCALQVLHPRCVLCKWGWVGPSKHNCRRIVFISLTKTTCFGRAWPSSGHYNWQY
jgi:hypothetical protein